MQSGTVPSACGKKLIGGAHGKKGYHGHNLGSMNQEYLNSLLSPSMLHASQGGSAMGSYGQPQGSNVNATRMSHGFPQGTSSGVGQHGALALSSNQDGRRTQQEIKSAQKNQLGGQVARSGNNTQL